MKLINRREFIKQCVYCSCGLAAWGMFPKFKLSNAFASTGNGTKVLFVNLNGGWDTLQVFQPASGQLYATMSSMRPTLITDPANLLLTTSNYGFHPNLTTFKTLWDEGNLATILNVGYENMSRSHQDAEVAFARGVIDRKNASSAGFINRLGDHYSFTSMQAVSVSGTDPVFGGGAYTAVQTPGLENYYFQYDGADWNEGYFQQDNLYSLSKNIITEEGKTKQVDAVNSVDLAINTTTAIKNAVATTTFQQNYANNNLGRSFKDAEILFSNPQLGTEIAYIRRGGFDTHSAQAGTFPNLLTELNSALGTFANNAKAKGFWNNLIVVIFSEFGRTNKENDSQGTDHGGASTVIVTGGKIKSGIFGDLLVTDLTDNGWLPQRYYTVELYRQVIAKMGYDPDPIFGNSAGPSLGGMFV